jgi:hypothetical protein
MADSLFFSRDTRVFIRLDSGDAAWEIPVLDGFSFSQATNASEVTLNEMADADGVSRRDRQLFNDSFAPAEWSFSTYARPFFASSKDRSVEQALWALLAGDAYYKSADNTFRDSSVSGSSYIAQGTGGTANQQVIDFGQSNKTNLGTASIWFVMGDSSDSAAAGDALTAYKIEGCCVNEVTFDFDIDGIATLNWSGMGKIIKEVAVTASDTSPTGVAGDDIWLKTDSPAYSNSSIQIAKTTDFAAVIKPTVDGIDSDTNYIRNRLSYLSASSTTTSGSVTLPLTGGNITISNNMTFVTPETLGVVNQPLGHVTGTRTVSGSVSCYLNNESNASADLFSDLIGATDTITNSFNLTFSIGGTIATTTPTIEFKMENCHLEIPTHNIEDVISLETNFHALPSTVGGTNELVISYAG